MRKRTPPCYVVFSWWLPSDSERYRDYRAAEACSSRAMKQGQTDCLSTWHLTVEKTANKPAGKSSSYRATLTDRDSWRGTVSFGDPGPLLDRLAPGDQVTAWNPYGTRLLITITAVCFGVGLPVTWIGIPWWTVPAVAVPVVVCAAGLTHARLRPRAAGGV